MNFTKEQRKAIGHREGHLQLIACAGSGKTEVVARRVANLLDPSASPRFTPANIIAFTFTDKAAAELKGANCRPRPGSAQRACLDSPRCLSERFMASASISSRPKFPST